jgi:hypothetical protein
LSAWIFGFFYKGVKASAIPRRIIKRIAQLYSGIPEIPNQVVNTYLPSVEVV